MCKPALRLRHFSERLLQGERNMSLRRRLSFFAAAAVVIAGGAVVLGLARSTAQAAALPSGFQEQIVFSGLTAPTSIQFAADGRVFIAQKNGVIKVYDS